jgi:hypothetical protein
VIGGAELSLEEEEDEEEEEFNAAMQLHQAPFTHNNNARSTAFPVQLHDQD